MSVHAVWLGALMLAGLAVAFENPAGLSSLGGAQWAAAGYLAVLVTAVAFLLRYRTVATVGAGRAGLPAGIAPLGRGRCGCPHGQRGPGPGGVAGPAGGDRGGGGGLRPDRAPREGARAPRTGRDFADRP
ncbi:hypothetical protein [Streptomyces sp. NPDC001502]|uniref:hypothetical protein n=1 Tax=Streptomyces sp. NPDC001502 TaxID=3364578 RepID=UPI00368C89C2